MNVAVLNRPVMLLIQGLVVAAVLSPFWFWDGGLIEIEALEFIPQYLADRGVLAKIFDPHRNDLGMYQARELSYFIDYLDANLFRLLIAAGHAIFVPASAVIASLLTVAVFLRGASRYLASAPITAYLLLLVYLTNYVHVVTMGMFYRSTKPMLAPLVITTTFYVLSLLGTVRPRSREAGRTEKRPGLAIFLLLSAMSLLDRQGFFYAVVVFALLLFHWIVAGGRRDRAFAAGAAVIVMVLYNVVIAPAIVYALNGYSPSFEFQAVPVGALMGLEPFARALELLLEGISLLGGSLPGALWVALLAIALILTLRRLHSSAQPAALGADVDRRPSWTIARIAGAVALVALSQVFMFAVMIVRHPPMYGIPDHRFWYYPLPFQALVITLAVPLLGVIVTGWNAWRRLVLNVLLASVVISNVVHWNMHLEYQRKWSWFSRVYYHSRALKLSLTDGRPYSSHVGYARFYRYLLTLSPPFRERAERAGFIAGPAPTPQK